METKTSHLVSRLNLSELSMERCPKLISSNTTLLVETSHFKNFLNSNIVICEPISYMGILIPFQATNSELEGQDWISISGGGDVILAESIPAIAF
jgi:hypothetical protein